MRGVFCSSDYQLTVTAAAGVSSHTKLQINCHAQSDKFVHSAIQQHGKIDNMHYFEAPCLVARCRIVTIHQLLFPEDEGSRSTETLMKQRDVPGHLLTAAAVRTSDL
jgi:hypothetical protein